MRRTAFAMLLVLSSLCTHRAWAWGCQGHQIVAYIASHNLNANATKNVAALLSNAQTQYMDDRQQEIKRWCAATELGDMEYFATWADDVRDAQNGDWHFWDIPLAKPSGAYPDYCGGNGCVVKAVAAQIKILQSAAASSSDRQRALLFIIHLVGDMHQPMHIVDNGDRGGNCVPVNFQYRGFSKTTAEAMNHGKGTGAYTPNLHSIWDTNMIAVYSNNKKDSDADEATSGLADEISKTYSTEISTEVHKSPDFANDEKLFSGWANATHQLAGQYSYTKMPVAIPVDPSPKTLASCSGVSDKFVSLDEAADTTFVDAAKPVIEKQLALAGARLAAILNTVWP
jgi:hypothetical protein